jgi:hypothetical protein
MERQRVDCTCMLSCTRSVPSAEYSILRTVTRSFGLGPHTISTKPREGICRILRGMNRILHPCSLHVVGAWKQKTAWRKTTWWKLQLSRSFTHREIFISRSYTSSPCYYLSRRIEFGHLVAANTLTPEVCWHCREGRTCRVRAYYFLLIQHSLIWNDFDNNQVVCL